MRFLAVFSFATLAAYVSAAESSKQCTSIEVRKEWRALTRAERKAWIDAVNCLNKALRSGKLNPPINTTAYSDIKLQIPPLNESSTYYDDLVYAHMNLNPVIHWTALFLPWHRVFVHEWTNILRCKCGYKGVTPYWAWENDAADFTGSNIWDTDTESGLGGFSGNPDDDYTIHTGALKISLAYPVPHNLRRQYIPYPFSNPNVPAASTFTPAEVDKLLAQPEGNFTAFQGYLEKRLGMHSAIHLMMGGDMGTLCPRGSFNTSACPVQRPSTFSNNEPMFYLHHANLDRFWWLWQEKCNVNKVAFHGGSVQNLSSLDVYPNGEPPWLNKSSLLPSAGLWDTYTIEQTMDTRSWPWCYVYE